MVRDSGSSMVDQPSHAESADEDGPTPDLPENESNADRQGGTHDPSED